MKERVEIFIVDDHPIYVDGLKNAFFKKAPEQFTVSAWAHTIVEAREKMKDSKAEIVLLDLKLPDETGVYFSAELKKNYPDKKVIILTGETDNDTLFCTWMNRVDAIVMKHAGIVELIEVINRVMSGERIVGKDVPLVFDSFNRSQDKNKLYLSKKEHQVLLLLMEGLTREEVAEKLFIARETVSSHCKKMFLKFKVNNLQLLIHELKQHRILG